MSQHQPAGGKKNQPLYPVDTTPDPELSNRNRDELDVEVKISGDLKVSPTHGYCPPLHERETDRGLDLVETNPDHLNLVQLYEEAVGTPVMDRLKELVKPLAGKKIAHINATAYGGGVAELLHRQIPLLNQLGEDIGFRNDWYILTVANPAFYDTTKKLHNLLQGAEDELTAEDRAHYEHAIRANYGEGMLDGYDLVFIHDPQPAGLITLYPERRNKWVWRCHIDTSHPHAGAWEMIGGYARQYDCAIWTRESFVDGREGFKEIRIIPPSIDPISPKNSFLGQEEVEAIFERFGIDPNRSVMLQVSRFDPWKQPLEVIRCHQGLKAEFPDLQLILAGSMASDDPEGMKYWESAQRLAGDDPDVFILSNANGVGNKEINAFQRGASAVIQYSRREGFGLTVSEGMWKGQPVIGGCAGGIQDQIIDGETGFLVSSNDELMAAVRTLLTDTDKRREMGEKARKRVKEHFLITREVADYLTLFGSQLT